MIVELSAEIVVRPKVLLRRHVVRAGDAIQQGDALDLRDALSEHVAFIVFDQRLIGAACGEASCADLSPRKEPWRVSCASAPCAISGRDLDGGTNVYLPCSVGCHTSVTRPRNRKRP
jgi:hypothetical protein